MGLLSAKVEHHTVATFFHQTRELSLEALNVAYGTLQTEVTDLLRREGFSEQEIRVTRFADVRYAGQSFELTVPVQGGQLDAEAVRAIERAFAAEHKRTYGHHGDDGEAYALTNLRVIGEVAGGREGLGARKSASVASRSGSRTAYFGAAYGWIETPVIGRGDLSANAAHGPLLIDEYDSTTVIPPHCTARLDSLNNIRINIQGVS
jgi:N-methylhydantoinase A